MTPDEIRAAIGKTDRVLDLLVAETIAKGGQERDALLHELLITASATSAAIIAVIARGDHTRAADLTDIVTLRMTEAVAKHGPRLHAQLSGAKP